MLNWRSLLGTRLSREDAIPNTRQEGAKAALIILSAINLLNFADRFVPAAVKELIQEDLNLSDLQSTYPTTGMVVVFMIFSNLFAYVVDKNVFDKRVVLAAAICLWSLATGLAGLATNLPQLVILRSIVGVGEAAYATIAPPMLADFFPHEDRNMVFAIYSICTPVGAALGFGIGGILGGLFSWRVSFLAVGLPGVLCSLAALRLNDPVSGLNDLDLEQDDTCSEESLGQIQIQVDAAITMSVEDTKKLTEEESCPFLSSNSSSETPSFYVTYWRDTKLIMTNWYFVWCVVGLCANNFAIGALAEWFPSYLVRYVGFSISSAGLLAGGVTVVGGIVGTVLGTQTVEFMEKRCHGSYFLVPALYTIPAGILILLLFNCTSSQVWVSILIFLGEICLWTFISPISTISISCIPTKLRSRSCGIMILLLHVLGDMISPPIVGGISTSIGSLKTGLQVSWIAILVSGICWYCGYHFLKPFRPPAEDSTLATASIFDLLFKKYEYPASSKANSTTNCKEPAVFISHDSPVLYSEVTGVADL